MKKLSLILILLMSCLGGKAQNTPVLTVVNGVYTYNSHQPFVLDLQFTVPSGQNISHIAVELSFTSNAATPGNHVYCEGATYGGVDMINSVTPFNASRTFTTNIVPISGEASTNMQFNLNTKEGVFCDLETLGLGMKTELTFQAKVLFYDAPAAPVPVGVLTSDTGVVALKAHSKWTVSNTMSVNEADLCLGGYVRYVVTVSHPNENTGAYNLQNAFVTYEIPLNATIIKVMKNGANVAFTHLSQTQSTRTIRLGSPGSLIVPGDNGSASDNYEVILQYPCDQFGLNTTYVTSAALAASDPCGLPPMINMASAPVSFNQSCCKICDKPAKFTKDGFASFGQFCPGSCVLSSYELLFDNYLSQVAYNNLKITDTLPAEVDVREIITDSNMPCDTLTYMLVPGGVQTVLNPSGKITLPPDTQVQWITWAYGSIPGFSGVRNTLRFRLSNTVLPGHHVINTARARALTPAFYEAAANDKVVENCQPLLSLSKRIFLGSGACEKTVTTLPNNIVTFRLRLQNTGSETLTGGQIKDNLDSRFEFVPNSVKYYSGTQECPSGGSMSASGPIVFTQSGSLLTFDNVNLEPQCSDVSKYLIIEFKAKVRPGTPSGTYDNIAILKSNTYGELQSNTVSVRVNDHFRVQSKMEVACVNGTFGTQLTAAPGDPLLYRITVSNTGNIAAKDLRIFSIRPDIGDEQSCCTPYARGSQFPILYTAAGLPPGNNMVEKYYNSMNCRAEVCNGDTICGSTGTITTARAIGLVAQNSNYILQPGYTFTYVFSAVAGQGAIGSKAYNDMAASMRRSDNNELITATCPPMTTVTLGNENEGCGKVTGCAEITYDTAYCEVGTADAFYSFCIKNNTAFEANTIKLKLPPGIVISSASAPGGYTYSTMAGGYHIFYSPQGIPPGNTLCGFTMRVNTALMDGLRLCYTVALHQGTEEHQPNCCYDSLNLHCINLTDCRDSCADILDLRAYCSEDKAGVRTYSLSFRVRNNGLTELDKIRLYSPLFDRYYSLPSPVLKYATSGNINIGPLTLAGSPSSICFNLTAYNMTIKAGTPCVDDSCNARLRCAPVSYPCLMQGPGSGGSQKGTGNSIPAGTFHIYPNPTHDQLTIQLSPLLEDTRLTLTDLAGKELKSVTIPANTGKLVLPLQDIAAGVYLLTGTAPNGTRILNERITRY